MFLHCGLVVATNLYKYMRTTSVDDSSHKWMHFVYSYTLEGNQRDIIALGTSTEKGTKRDRQWTGPVQIKNEAKPLSNQVIIAKQTNEKESNTHNINREKLAAWHFFVVMLFTKPLHNRNPLSMVNEMNADWEKNNRKDKENNHFQARSCPNILSHWLVGMGNSFTSMNRKEESNFVVLFYFFPFFLNILCGWLVHLGERLSSSSPSSTFISTFNILTHFEWLFGHTAHMLWLASNIVVDILIGLSTSFVFSILRFARLSLPGEVAWVVDMRICMYMAINLSKWSLATPVCVSSLSSVTSLCLWPNDAYVVWQGFSFAQRSATEPAGNNTRDVHVSCAMCVSACERSKWHKPHTTHSSHTHTIRKKINDML